MVLTWAIKESKVTFEYCQIYFKSLLIHSNKDQHFWLDLKVNITLILEITNFLFKLKI